MLGVTLVVAWRFMHDLGLHPAPRRERRHAVRTWSGLDRRRLAQSAGSLADARRAVHGRGRASTSSTPSQPYLLQLYGDPTAYGIAGLAAAIVAGAQIVGGLLVARVRRLFRRRTDALLLGGVATARPARPDRPDHELP